MISFLTFNFLALASCLFIGIFSMESPGQFLWLPLIYIGFYYAYIVLFILMMFVSSLFVSKKKNYTDIHPFYHWIQVRIIEVLCMLCLVRLKVKGMEIVPKDRPFYLVGNHQSIFDPMLTSMILKKWRFIFISKPENFKIPFIGRVLHRNGYLAIDRENNRNALITMSRAIELMSKQGYSIGIYPEGHRNKTDDVLLPFHAGSFRVPLKAKVPVLIAVIDGADRLSRRKFLYPQTVEIRFVEVVETESFNNDTQSLSDYCRQRILNDLAAHAR